MFKIVTREERMWATICHVATFAGCILPGVGHVAGPLIVWLMKREDYPLVDDQGKEALNFQISMTIYTVLALPLFFVLVGIPILIALSLIDLILTVIAAVRTNNGERYHYPLSIRLVR